MLLNSKCLILEPLSCICNYRVLGLVIYGESKFIIFVLQNRILNEALFGGFDSLCDFVFTDNVDERLRPDVALTDYRLTGMA